MANKRISNYFHAPPKKSIKLNKSSNDVFVELSSESMGVTANESIENAKETEKECEELESILKFDLVFNGRWIEAEHLKLKYGKLFPNNLAGKILQRLENEVEYFTGDFLKVRIFGKWHDIPRKQVSFGDSGLSYKFSGNCIPALPWTSLMLELKEAVENAVNYKFNFVLVNRYNDGTDYIGEHRDDEKDLLADAPIASLSFGQCRDFIFKHKDSRGVKATRKIDPVKLELEHGTLLVMYPPTNSYWYHSLPVRKKAQNVRVNLTFRRML